MYLAEEINPALCNEIRGCVPVLFFVCVFFCTSHNIPLAFMDSLLLRCHSWQASKEKSWVRSNRSFMVGLVDMLVLQEHCFMNGTGR